MTSQMTETIVETNGTRLNVAVGGDGPAVLLMHGFPHTWWVWKYITSALTDRYRVIAPDLRGLGASDREVSGYDARNLADDMIGLLDALDEPLSAVVALDAGVPPAFLLGLEHRERVSRLTLIESTVGRLPGAEDCFSAGPPWWFGFHAVPGFAETVLAGNEAAYVDFFLRSGTASGEGIELPVRDAFLTAYSAPGALRCAFEYYRAMPENAAQITVATSNQRLSVPTLVVGGQVVGDATARQLAPYADDLTSELIPSSGHIVPLDAPDELLRILGPFLASTLTGPDDR